MKIYAVGLGPGDMDYLAPRAREVLLQCDVIVGYTGYISLIPELIKGKEVISTGMKGEVERCQAAINEAIKGKQVCVVSSGDAGIYGMASILFELLEKSSVNKQIQKGEEEVDIEVIPGITAAASAAAILGSPLTSDFAVISLSDLLTPWDVIEKRLLACSAADMVTCLYNPQSKTRNDYLEKACAIIAKHKPLDTPCGYVRNALRGTDTDYRVCTLADLPTAKVDMFTTVIIGNSCTKVIGGKLITSRGYMI